jgi:hypothetical protein
MATLIEEALDKITAEVNNQDKYNEGWEELLSLLEEEEPLPEKYRMRNSIYYYHKDGYEHRLMDQLIGMLKNGKIQVRVYDNKGRTIKTYYPTGVRHGA